MADSLVAPPPIGTPFQDAGGRITAPWVSWLQSVARVLVVTNGTVGGALVAANNLSDLGNKVTARSNLGLGSAATRPASDFDPAGAASTVQAASLQKSANLSDLANLATAQSNLGLAASATIDTTNAANITTGTLPVGRLPTVPIANGGSGQTTQAAAITALTGTQTAGRYLRSDGTNALLAAILAADVPTLNQSTTGTAANVSGTVAIANGGTGSTSAGAALTALGAAALSGGNTFSGNQAITGTGGTTSALAVTAAASSGTARFTSTSDSFSSLVLVGPSANLIHGTTGTTFFLQNSAGVIQFLSAVTANLTVTAAGLRSSAGLVANIATKTAAYTVLTSDYSIEADATTAAFTVTLPASPVTGQMVNVIKIDAGANVVTVSAGASTINGTTTKALTTQWQSLKLQYNGSAWRAL